MGEFRSLKELLEQMRGMRGAERSKALAQLFTELPVTPEELEREGQRRARLDEVGREYGQEPVGALGTWRYLRSSQYADDGAELRAFVLGRSGLDPETRESMRFATFKPRASFPTVAQALAASRGFVSRGGKPFLTLAGPPGCGKSHLLQALAWEGVERDVLVLYCRQDRLLNKLRGSFESRGFDQALADVCECSWLLIDDLGVEGASTDWSRGILDQIIDYRWSRRLPLVVATNATSGDVLSPRLADRLRDRDIGVTVNISAPSWRSHGQR